MPLAARKQKPGWKHWVSLGINIGLFAVSLLVMQHILTQYKVSDILASLHQIGLAYVGASLALTVLGYGALVGYDYLSLRIAGHPISIRRMWSASFISHAVQNSAPVSILAGGGLRYRLFSRLGVTGGETAAVVAANLVTFVIGLFAVAGLSFVIAPVPIPASFHLPIHSLQPLGFVFIALVIVAIIVSEIGGKFTLWRWKIELPEGGVLRSQLAVSVADWLLSSTALYVLMIAGGPVSYPKFLSGFLLAQIVTQVIPLPGGVGVFEAAILLLRPSGLGAPLATAALLLYRVIYYLVPLFAATAVLAVESSQKSRSQTSAAVRVARDVAPHLFAVLTFIAGAALLAFDTLPGRAHGFKWLGDVLQLALVEGSRFIGSLVGTGLLLLAFGLERRLRSAFHLTIGLLLLGIPTALVRTMDVTTAAVLTVLMLLLLVARGEFHRKIPFSAEPINAGWTAATLVAIAGIAWLGIVLQMHGEYSSSLWWKFALDDNAPGSLRVALGALLTLVVYAAARFVARARHGRQIRRRTPSAASPAKSPPPAAGRRPSRTGRQR
jgi:phosphatidylglycerol lysyltransferase